MIPYGRQTIDDDDIRAVAEVLRSDFLTGGPAVERFEAALGRVVEAPHVVACANGTAALHLTMLALGLGPGDAAVAPTLTFLATANAARFVGADVRFADVDPDTGLMTPETLDRALNTPGPGHVRAVIVVHLNGQSADMAAISALARARGLAVIEDACHALGGSHAVDGRLSPVGACSASDAASFSFHPVKTIAMGEGGAITTRDAAFAEKMRRFRNHGMVRGPEAFKGRGEGVDHDGAPNPWIYEMPELGFNFRASDIHCALGHSQLAKLPKFLKRRRALAALYDAALARLASVVRPVPRGPSAQDGWHLYPVLIDFAAVGRSRAAVMTALRERGVGTQVHYLPVHRQTYYRRLYPDLTLPGANAYYDRCLTLPLFPAMGDADVAFVVTALAQALGLDSASPPVAAAAP